MRTGLFIATLILILAGQGCKEGGCYYTCCIAESDCLSHCLSGIKSAEKCAIRASEDCTEGDEGYLTRVEWSEIDNLFCDNCTSPVCAPNWWKINQKAEAAAMMNADTDTTTATDSSGP